MAGGTGADRDCLPVRWLFIGEQQTSGNQQLKRCRFDGLFGAIDWSNASSVEGQDATISGQSSRRIMSRLLMDSPRS